MPFLHLPVHKKKEFIRWLYCICICWFFSLSVIVVLTATQNMKLYKTKKQIQQLQQNTQLGMSDAAQRNVMLQERKKSIDGLRKKKNRFNVLQQVVSALPEKTTLTQFCLSKKQLELAGILTDHTVLSLLLTNLRKLPLKHINVTELSQNQENDHFNFCLKADILE